MCHCECVFQNSLSLDLLFPHDCIVYTLDDSINIFSELLEACNDDSIAL